MKGSKLALLWILMFLASGCIVYGILTYQKIIASTGTVKTVNVGAYWDWSCTDVISFIDWGMIEPGSSANATVYLRNEGNSPAILSLNVTNWSPVEAEGFMSLSWDYNGDDLKPGEVLPLYLTLSVAQNITGITSFSFEITIIGEG